MKDNGDATAVFWDINTCPIPNNGFDARWVRPSIKRFLRNLGYSGPLTVTAVGILSGVPLDILEGVYSSGICLANVRDNTSWPCHGDVIDEYCRRNPPPANIMVISGPGAACHCVPRMLEVDGFNVLRPCPFDSLHGFFHPDVSDLIWESNDRPPGNIMLISNERICFSPSLSTMLDATGYNLIQPFPYPSVESLLFPTLTGAHEEDRYSETSESAHWFCEVCFPGFIFQGFDYLTTHLQSSEHQQKVSDVPPMNIRLQYMVQPLSECLDLKAVTVVFWDINLCPIPTGVDARLVGPRIKHFLEKSGYSGPLAITAVGALKDVPNSILGELFSSGITLKNVIDNGSSSFEFLLFEFKVKNPPPANIMVISDPTISPSENSLLLQSSGYNLIQPYPYESLQCFLPTDSGELDCSETGESASWVCSVCDSPPDPVFENFTTHLSSQLHERKTLGSRPRKKITDAELFD